MAETLQNLLGALEEGAALKEVTTGKIVFLCEYNETTGELTRANLTAGEVGGTWNVHSKPGEPPIIGIDDALGRTAPTA